MSDKTNIVKVKSKRFAVRVINMYKYLCGEKREFVISKQVFVYHVIKENI